MVTSARGDNGVADTGVAASSLAIAAVTARASGAEPQGFRVLLGLSGGTCWDLAPGYIPSRPPQFPCAPAALRATA